MNAILHRRLQNTQLAGPGFSTPWHVVRWLGAVQSQDYGPACWAIAQRTKAGMQRVSDEAVQRAHDDGAFTLVHALRPTWHFLRLDDMRWIQMLTGPRVQMGNGTRYRQLDLDESVRKRTRRFLTRLLDGSVPLTRTEIQAALTKDDPDARGQKLAYILMDAELELIICGGPRKGKQHTYRLVPGRGGRRDRTRDEALRELTQRYFTSHGPATAKDFRWWSSLTLADIKQGLEMTGDALTAEIVDGVEYWSARGMPYSELHPPLIHLLQGYDEYIVGYSESKWLLAPPGRMFVQPMTVPNGLVILDGRVCGHWKRKINQDSLDLTVLHYALLRGKHSDALESAANEMGRSLRLRTNLIVEPI